MIHPWDAAVDDAEWRAWIARGRDFGQLAVNGADGGPPVVVPTHAAPVRGALLIHLARPNPVWRALGEGDPVTFTVIDDYAFVPGPWRAQPGTDPLAGVPTSYYSAVRFTCRAEIVDDPAAKAELLTRQLAHFQPGGDHAEVTPHGPPFGRMLSGIRGLVLHVEEAAVKFKYDDHRPVALREEIADRLTGRGGREAGAAVQQRRRAAAVGPWEKKG